MQMEKVTSLHKGAVPIGQPVPQIVEMLENLLEKAKNGDIQAMAYATCGGVENGFGNGWESNGGTRDVLGASIAHLNSRYFIQAYDN